MLTCPKYTCNIISVDNNKRCQTLKGETNNEQTKINRCFNGFRDINATT